MDYQQLLKKYKFRSEDFSQYRPKKYYTEDDTQAIQQSKDLEEFKKQYKYYEDLPRSGIQTYGMHRQDTYRNAYLYCSMMASFFAGRMFANEYYGIYNTPARIRLCRLGTFAFLAWAGMWLIPASPIFTPQNSGILKPEYLERKLQRDLDLELNLYQNVDKINNTDEEPTWLEYRQVVRKVKENSMVNIKVN